MNNSAAEIDTAHFNFPVIKKVSKNVSTVPVTRQVIALTKDRECLTSDIRTPKVEAYISQVTQ